MGLHSECELGILRMIRRALSLELQRHWECTSNSIGKGKKG